MLKVGVVDDDVGQGTRFDLGEIHSAKTESTIKIASGGALIFVSRWSSPVSGSCPHSATLPEPPGPAGDSSRSRAEPKS